MTGMRELATDPLGAGPVQAPAMARLMGMVRKGAPASSTSSSGMSSGSSSVQSQTPYGMAELDQVPFADRGAFQELRAFLREADAANAAGRDMNRVQAANAWRELRRSGAKQARARPRKAAGRRKGGRRR